MDKYNFDDTKDWDLGETIRLDEIKEKAKTDSSVFDENSLKSGLRRAAYEENERLRLKEKVREKDPVSGSASKGGLYMAGKKRRSRMQYRIFMIIAIISCVIAFISVFSYTFRSLKNNASKGAQSNGQEENGDLPVTEKNEFFVLIKNINSGNEISFYNITSGKDGYVALKDGARITDEYEKEISLSQIAMGDIVKIHAVGESADSVSLSTDIWTEEDISDFNLDHAKRIVEFGGKICLYNENTLFMSEGRLTEDLKIDGSDTVTLKGIGKTIWSVNLTGHHGTVLVKNKDGIKNPSVTIDGAKTLSLSDSPEFKVSPGEHSFVIKGDNIEDYTISTIILPNEIFELDLSDTSGKTCVLVLKTNVTGYNLYINGTLVDNPGDPHELAAGEYKIKVEKDGYLTYESNVSIKDTLTNLTVNLTKNVQKSKVTISTTPSAAYIFLDELYVGLSPILVDTEYGEHTVRIERNDYDTLNGSINVTGPNQTFHFKLEN